MLVAVRMEVPRTLARSAHRRGLGHDGAYQKGDLPPVAFIRPHRGLWER